MLLTDTFNHRRSFKGQRSWCYINSLEKSLGLTGSRRLPCCSGLWISDGHPHPFRPWSSGQGVTPGCDWQFLIALGSFRQGWPPPQSWASFRVVLSQPDPACNSQGFSICIFQARDLCTPSLPVWIDFQCFYFLEMPKSVAAFWIDLLSHLKGGRNFVTSVPPTGL